MMQETLERNTLGKARSFLSFHSVLSFVGSLGVLNF